MGKSLIYAEAMLYSIEKRCLIKKVEQNGEVKYQSLLVLVSPSIVRRMHPVCSVVAEEWTKIIENNIERLKNDLEGCGVLSTLSFEEVACFAVGAMILDVGTINRLIEEGLMPLPPEKPGGTRWYMGAYKLPFPPMRNFGVNVFVEPEFGYAYVHSPLTQRTVSPKQLIDSETKEIIQVLREKPLGEEELAHELTEKTRESVGKSLDASILTRVHMNDEIKLSLNFPYFTRQKQLELRSVYDTILQELAKSFGRHKPEMREVYRLCDLARFSLDFEDTLWMFHEFIYPLCFDRLVETGTLPDIPERVKGNWGFGAWDATPLSASLGLGLSFT
jgi:hypothetical protein